MITLQQVKTKITNTFTQVVEQKSYHEKFYILLRETARELEHQIEDLKMHPEIVFDLISPEPKLKIKFWYRGDFNIIEIPLKQ